MRTTSGSRLAPLVRTSEPPDPGVPSVKLSAMAGTARHRIEQGVRHDCRADLGSGARRSSPGAAATAVRATSLATATGFLPSLKRYDAYSGLVSITAKTIVVSGGTDLLTPASHARDLTAAIPGAVHHHHPTAGHMLLHDAAECVSNAIGRAMEAPRRVATGASRSEKAQLAVVVS